MACPSRGRSGGKPQNPSNGHGCMCLSHPRHIPMDTISTTMPASVLSSTSHGPQKEITSVHSEALELCGAEDASATRWQENDQSDRQSVEAHCRCRSSESVQPPRLSAPEVSAAEASHRKVWPPHLLAHRITSVGISQAVEKRRVLTHTAPPSRGRCGKPY